MYPTTGTLRFEHFERCGVASLAEATVYWAVDEVPHSTTRARRLDQTAIRSNELLRCLESGMLTKRVPPPIHGRLRVVTAHSINVPPRSLAGKRNDEKKGPNAPTTAACEGRR